MTNPFPVDSPASSAPAEDPVRCDAEAGKAGTLLFVDDEPNILVSLIRLFRPLGYRLFTATSGREGLAVLEREAVDVVVSDMRMPEMTGAELFEQTAKRWPGVMNILLTGCTDLNLTIAAINKGHIYKYVGKPWEDAELRMTVQRALERKRLEEERADLVRTIQRQNAELLDLNANLEAKVEARVAEIEQVMAMVEKAHDELRSNFVDILGVLSSIIEAREGGVAGHSRRIAHLAHLLALELGLSEPQAEAVRVASLLHDIGKVGLPDPLIGRPFAALTREERDTVMQHPVIGEAMLMSLHSMHDVGTLIRSHHEHYDGSGFPDGLRGGAIPIGARILAVVSDYDLLRSGRLLIDRLDDKQAQHYLTGRRGTHYDPTVVDAFCHLLKSLPEGYDLDEAPVTPEQLQAGMRLSRDMLTRTGMVLLHKGKVIDEALAAKIRSLARNADTGIKIWVVRTPSSPDTPPQSSA